MRIATTTACALAATLFAGSALGKPACVYRAAALRSGPGTAEHLIGVIPALSPIVLVRRGETWSIVSYDGETGYLATRALSRTQPEASASRAYDETLNPGRTLVREIDPLFGEAGLDRYFGPRSTPLRESNYFTGFRRASWTDMTERRAASTPAPGSPCAVASTSGNRHEPGDRHER